MITACGIDIDAPADLVWTVFSDVERWPEWTASVTRLVALDGPGLEVGRRFAIKQPRMPRLVWAVTEMVPGASWTWEQRSPGGLTIARHDVAAASATATRIDQRLEQRGPVGALVGALVRSMTRRYLDLEAAGLKARCEQLHHADGSAP
ncbi:Polyketide cyclase / dehydrase and lipid transport [Mycolicibacterium rutilum]|uniref:Polyketide cyclase / dehydrase and lipid transport n=1 Tax=Mycolicibacterium rutilum TaxID=370526 RepID=A0A1H6LUW3_MYCRU|nr:SRPBCC family protein [Mycolicibacterium rutilum]SEH88837.1 Polyketide cyclase / dehydrase and lipid transport [Mycolicibacterium rutilum]